MENEKLDNKEYIDNSFSNDELSKIKSRFNILLYYPYERISEDKSSLSYILPCVPFLCRMMIGNLYVVALRYTLIR